MTVLVIGAGSIGKRHAENLATLNAAPELVPWRGYSADRLADRLATDKGIQGVVIATATDIRLSVIAVCSAHDMPFYVEKPLACRKADLDAICMAAAPVASRSMVGFMMRYHPAFRALAQSDLSDVFRFALEIGHDVTQWRDNWRFSTSYASRADCGGVLLDLCHELDMASCLFAGLSVQSSQSLGHASYPGVDMASSVQLMAPGGATGTVSMDYLAPKLVRRTCLRGQERSHDFDFASQTYALTDRNGTSLLALPHERNQMFLAAMADFLALSSGAAPSGVEHLPRFDLTQPTCALIADAWESRVFIGQIAKELP